MINEQTFKALNAVYLRKMATVNALAECAGLEVDAARALVDEAVANGLLLDLGGQYMLQEDGTRAVLEFYTETYSEQRQNQDLVGWYDRFEIINTQFLKLVSDWQAEQSGDDATLGRLTRTVERLIKALSQAIDIIPRYQIYADRFAAALARVDQGDHSYVSSPTTDSMHNVWFEFHEDILAVLGKPRDTVED
ncbi:MAG: hypothetical protein COA65_07395 [Rhodospirillaceae bacterium]|nr:MAG: hypothetical protein COA65_07395 [Rhodospirillaceae bacterium]